MSEQASQQDETRADRRLGWLIFAGCFAVVIAIFVFTPGAWNVALPETLKFDLAPLFAQSWLVQFHVATVAIAVGMTSVKTAHATSPKNAPTDTRALNAPHTTRNIGSDWRSA